MFKDQQKIIDLLRTNGGSMDIEMLLLELSRDGGSLIKASHVLEALKTANAVKADGSTIQLICPTEAATA